MTAPAPCTRDNPLIVQGDRSLLLDVHAPLAEEARSAVARFAELERSPEHFHAYRITSFSLWNAAASGLERFSRYAVPENVLADVRDLLGERLSLRAFRVPLRHRGTLKQALLAAGWPAED